MKKNKVLQTSLHIAIILVSSILSLPASTLEKKPNIIVSTKQSDELSDLHFRDLIDAVISEEFAYFGFSIIFVENYKDRQELVQTAEWMDASYIIENTLYMKKSQLQWQLNCFSLQDDTELFNSIKKAEQINSAELQIRTTFEELIPLIRKDLQPKVSDPINGNSFIIQLGAAPLIAIGDVTKYFNVGLETHLLAGYRFYPNETFELLLGLYTGLSYFQANGILTSSQNFLTSLGPEIRLGTEVNSLMNIYVRLSSGISIFTVNTNKHGIMNTIIPYVSAGIGSDIHLSEHFGFSVLLGYSLFLEGSTIIQGFVPGAGMYIEF